MEEQPIEQPNKIKRFAKETLRVLRITKKPNRAEYQSLVKVTGIGILIIGAIGFIIFRTSNLQKDRFRTDPTHPSVRNYPFIETKVGAGLLLRRIEMRACLFACLIDRLDGLCLPLWQLNRIARCLTNNLRSFAKLSGWNPFARRRAVGPLATLQLHWRLADDAGLGLALRLRPRAYVRSRHLFRGSPHSSRTSRR